jgi:hypothetical protein
LEIRAALDALVLAIPRYKEPIWEKKRRKITRRGKTWLRCTWKDRPVALAQAKITKEAMKNLIPPAVKGPIPETLILMATVLAPKAALRNIARATE